MSYVNSNEQNRLVRPPVFRETDVLFLCLGCGTLLILLYIATTRWHFTMRQIQEIAAYCLLTVGFSYVGIWHFVTKAKRKQQAWLPVPIAPRIMTPVYRPRCGTVSHSGRAAGPGVVW